jgi:low affinity Fe/Cu permease
MSTPTLPESPHANQCSCFDRIASWFSELTGSSGAFLSAVAVVIIWALLGPFFHFSETWQLVINTGTTIVTFLLLFIVQNTQMRDTEALHLKLDALIFVASECDNALMNAETLGHKELKALIANYQKKANRTVMEGRHPLTQAEPDTAST